MELDADKVITNLKQIIADQAGQIAMLQAMIEKLQTTES